jgi:hypothetical protein
MWSFEENQRMEKAETVFVGLAREADGDAVAIRMYALA